MPPSNWSISFCHFNRFWQVYYPQIIGKVWESNDTEFYNIRFDICNAGSAAKSEILDYLRNKIGNEENEAERNAIADELQNMEIRLMPGIGYFFAFKDKGLDLPRPPKPTELQDVFRQYQYRRVGAPAISIPNLAICGEGKILTRSAASYSGRNFIDLGDGPPLKLNEMFSDDALDIWKETISILVSKNQPSASENETGFNPTPEFYHILDDLCDAGNRPNEWWRIKGQDFMNIQVELPRVIAHVWFDEVLQGGQVPEFKRRFLNQDSRTGAPEEDKRKNRTRGVFNERLETTLHQNLNFSVSDLKKTPGADKECKITNTGIYLVLPERPQDLQTMFKIWAAGEAGNPIFTDTYHCS